MVAHAQAEAARLKLDKIRYEFQMIYGIRRDLQDQVRAAGDTLQVYVPFGTDWCPYFHAPSLRAPGELLVCTAQPHRRVRRRFTPTRD